jgi:hypothetical protein
MTITRYILSLIIYIFCILNIDAELIDSTVFSVANISTFSTGKLTPFWLQSNKAGQIAAQPINNSLSIGLKKEISQSPKYGVGYGIEALYQAASQNSEIYLHEAYLEGKLYFLNLTIGIRNQFYGNQFDPLSSGGFIFSGNCRPMPMIRIYAPKYTAVPFTHDFIEVKGAFEYARAFDNSLMQNTLLHYKNAFIRIGGSLPVRINYGLHHAAQWGGKSPSFGQMGSSLKDFWEVVLIKSGDSNDPINDQINKKGNHIISQNYGVEISLYDFEISTYWQNINEDKPIDYFIINSPNRPDKLLGFSISNNKFPFVQNILIEYLNTTDQSGPYLDKDGVVFGGSDNYFSNYLYPQGYSYYERIIGTPLITSPIMNVDGNTQVINNSVKAWHYGISGKVNNLNYKLFATHSHNYGSDYYQINKSIKENYSFLSEFSTVIKKLSGIEFLVSFGYDKGELFGDSFGIQIGFRSNHLLKSIIKKGSKSTN